MKSTEWLINELNNSPAFQSHLFEEEFKTALEMEKNMNKSLSGAPLYYPGAREWMWNYCIYLGPFTTSKGKNLDLGIYIDDVDGSISNATVNGDYPGDYYSGDIYPRLAFDNEVTQEVIRRAKELKLIL